MWAGRVRAVVAAGVVGLAAAGCGSPSPVPLGDAPLVQYGWIRDIDRVGTDYRLRLDLGIVLTGAAGEQACLADGECRPGQALSDDTYQRDFNSIVVYRVPPETPVVAVGAGPNGAVGGPTRITAAELAALFHGRRRDPRLLAPAGGLPWWVRVDTSGNVSRLEQQYIP